MSGKGDNPRKFNKESHRNYLSNPFWDNIEKEKQLQQLEHERRSKDK